MEEPKALMGDCRGEGSGLGCFVQNRYTEQVSMIIFIVIKKNRALPTNLHKGGIRVTRDLKALYDSFTSSGG